MTWGNDPAVVAPIVEMMMQSRQAVVNYMTPLGLHHCVESVEVGRIGDRALHRAGIGSEVGHSGVERFLLGLAGQLVPGATEVGAGAGRIGDPDHRLRTAQHALGLGGGFLHQALDQVEIVDVAMDDLAGLCGLRELGLGRPARPDAGRSPRPPR